MFGQIVCEDIYLLRGSGPLAIRPILENVHVLAIYNGSDGENLHDIPHMLSRQQLRTE
jgi:hypothetical protein